MFQKCFLEVRCDMDKKQGNQKRDQGGTNVPSKCKVMRNHTWAMTDEIGKGLI